MPATSTLMLFPVALSATTGLTAPEYDSTCAAPFASSETTSSTASYTFDTDACEAWEQQTDEVLMSLADDEIGTTLDAFTRAELCGVACQIAYGIGCAAIAVSCPVGSAITLGGLTIPCSIAIVAACAVIQPAGVLTCTKACA